jgi:hypothetical protein
METKNLTKDQLIEELEKADKIIKEQSIDIKKRAREIITLDLEIGRLKAEKSTLEIENKMFSKLIVELGSKVFKEIFYKTKNND